MSHNQTRADRSDGQLRKPGRSSGGSGHHRGSPSAAWKAASGGGRSGAPPAPVPSPAAASDVYNPQPSVATSRSFKKPGNGQGLQQQDSGGSQVASSIPPRSIQNGLHPPPSSGVPEGPFPSNAAAVIAPKTSRPLPRPPAPQSHSGSSDPATPKTPMKGEAQNPFPLQFGSISPGFMNGVKIPARTSSAPPNLDEQKRDQAQYGHSMALPTTSVSSLPKQQQQQQQQNQPQIPKKEGPVPSQQKIDVQPPLQSKREPNIAAPSATVAHQSSGTPLPGLPMPVFQNPHLPMQFSGAGPQMQSQSAGAASLQMQMLPLNVGAQQIPFFPTMQQHALSSQGIMHQTHGLNFSPQMGHQLPPQIGNLGMGINMQYTQQQQVGALGGQQRKTSVKITDPKTREELRLDKRNDLGTDSMQKPQVSMPHQSQAPPAFTPSHQVPYYQGMQPSTFNPNQMYMSTSSLPLPSMQMTTSSQPPRFSFGQTGGTISIVNPTSAINKNGPPGITDSANLRHSHDGHSLPISGPSASVRVTVKAPPDHLSARRSGITVTSTPTTTISKAEGNKVIKLPEDHCLSQSVKRNEASGQQPTSTTSIMRHPDTPYLDVANQGTKPIGTVEVSESKSSATTDFRNQTIKKSNLLADSHRRTGQKDIEETKQNIQTDLPDSVSSPKLHTIGSPSNIPPEVFPELELKSYSRDQELLESSETHVSPNYISSVIGKDDGPNQVTDNIVLKDPKCPQVAISSPITSIPNESVRLEVQPQRSSSGAQETDRGVVSADSAEDTNNAMVYSASGNVESSPVKSTTVMVVGEGAPEGLVITSSDKSNDADGEKLVPKDEESERSVSASRMEMIVASDNCPLDSTSNIATTSSDLSAKDAMSLRSDRCEDKAESAPQQAAASADSEKSFPASNSADMIYKSRKADDNVASDSIHPSLASGVLDKPVEAVRSKTAIGKKKKKKDILSKADAEGMNSDLYMAYKGTNEKQESINAVASVGSLVTVVEHTHDDDTKEPDIACSEEPEQSKGELDDWEDVVEVSSPKLSDNLIQSETDKKLNDVEGGLMSKKYSRDFLMKFSDQFMDLPAGFEIGSDIANAVMSSQVPSSRVMVRDQYASSARIIDRPSSASRMDRRSGNTQDDDKWSKVPPASAFIRDVRSDIGQGVPGGRTGQGINQGVLRNPRGQSNQYGLLPNSLQSPGVQGGGSKNNIEADRWTRNRGLMPPPSPAQAMHKAEKKYTVGKVSDTEELKQRQLKGILNKLTPQNFDRLFEQVKEVNIDNVITLKGVISQIFDKALMEPTFCEMYADFCVHLASALPDFTEDNEKVTFRRLLLNKCQEEFERGEREQAEAEKVEEEGEVKQTVEQREEKKVKARRKMLGNIRLIGELYKKKMLTERIMHECIKKLLRQYQDPDEEDIEALCKLMTTIGEVIDQPRAKEHIDVYFNMMSTLSVNLKLSSRLRFMLKDVIDLRKNKWQQRRKIEGPKKIEEVHRDAAQERQAQASRSSRGPVMSSSARRGPPVDYGSHGPGALSSSGPASQQMALLRFPHSARGSVQDVRMEDRHLSESRTPSVPLPQRPINNDSITLGPQGGLAKGMSIRGHNLTSEEPRRAILGPNISSSREELGHRNLADRYSVPSSERPASVDRNPYSSNRDPRNIDNNSERLSSTSTASAVHGVSTGHQSTISADNSLSEETIREKSISAIREYYSIKDENEVALCIKELNSPNFGSSIVSTWVTHSFERKEIERELLTSLVINFSRSPHSLFSQTQLVQGFESVLSLLEDAVNDAPKAAEFLGRMLARVVLENVIPVREIGRLLREGGEEPGRLLEIGLSADVLASILETIKAEKGESGLKEMQRSNFRFEDFRPPHPMISRKLEAFL